MGNHPCGFGDCWVWMTAPDRAFSSAEPPQQRSATDAPDFTCPTYWLAHPIHHPDRIRANLPSSVRVAQPDGSFQTHSPDEDAYRDSQDTAPADVFFLHGTMEGRGNRASINRYEQEHWDGFNTHHQMSMITAFTPVCKAYAPLYRQSAGGGDFDLAFQDVLEAFEHYLIETTPDRPLVLAGHSQGSMHLSRLMKERIAGDATILSRLVGIFAPGTGNWTHASSLPVEDGTQPTMGAPNPTVALWAAATPGADREKTLIGWMSKGAKLVNFANPCAWTDGKHLGSLLPDEETRRPLLYRGLVEQSTIEGGLLRVHAATGAEEALAKFCFGSGDYHAYDIHLFWGNVRHRVQQQVEAFVMSKA